MNLLTCPLVYTWVKQLRRPSRQRSVPSLCLSQKSSATLDWIPERHWRQLASWLTWIRKVPAFQSNFISLCMSCLEFSAYIEYKSCVTHLWNDALELRCQSIFPMFSGSHALSLGAELAELLEEKLWHFEDTAGGCGRTDRSVTASHSMCFSQSVWEIYRRVEILNVASPLAPYRLRHSGWWVMLLESRSYLEPVFTIAWPQHTCGAVAAGF